MEIIILGVTMKKIVLTLALFVFLVGTVIAADSGKKYGKVLEQNYEYDLMSPAKLMEKYVGKKVLVSGTVVDVCAHRGCWIKLASDKPYQDIRVKVKDGEIVFPLTAKGKSALVEGEVTKIELTKEQAMKVKKHQCEEKGKKFDPSSVKEGMIIYQIKGLGAVIK